METGSTSFTPLPDAQALSHTCVGTPNERCRRFCFGGEGSTEVRPAGRRENVDAEDRGRVFGDEMIAATGIAGTPGQCRNPIGRYRAAGLDLPIVSPFARGPDAKRRFPAAIEACAP